MKVVALFLYFPIPLEPGQLNSYTQDMDNLVQKGQDFQDQG